MRPVRAVLFGIGPIGAAIGRLAAQRDEIELAGAIDSAGSTMCWKWNRRPESRTP